MTFSGALVQNLSDKSPPLTRDLYEPIDCNVTNRRIDASGYDLPAFCGPLQASEMAVSGLVADSFRLNSAGVNCPKLECGRISLK
jgi:hypothetical protein